MKGFFDRERAHISEMDDLKSQHEKPIFNLQLQIGALQLQHASAKAYFDYTKTQLESLKKDLLERKPLALKRFDQNTQTQKRLENLPSCYESSCEALTAQAGDIKQRAKDLEAARALVERLEALLDATRSADGARPETLAVGIDIARFTQHSGRRAVGAGLLDRRHEHRRSSITYGYRRLCGEQDAASIPVVVTRRQGM